MGKVGIRHDARSSAQSIPRRSEKPKPDTVAQSNSKSHVIIPSRRINGLDYKVFFFFNHQGLAQVTLEAENASRLNLDSIESILREKYGEPISVKDNKVVRNVDWYNSPLSVDLTYIGDPDMPEIYIFYNQSRYDAMNSL